MFVNASAELDFKNAKEQLIRNFERQYLEDLLKKHNNNISKVAAEAGLNRKTIYRMMEDLGIQARKN